MAEQRPDPAGDADGGIEDAISMATGWAAPFISGDAQVELTPARAERRRLAAAVRRITHAMLAGDVSMEVTTAAADELEALAARLEAAPEAVYEGFAEAANAPRVDVFVDRSPVLGKANPLAPPLEIDFSQHEQIVATATFGAAYEGPPGCVHGGWIAAAFDEVLGAAQSLSGSGGMTAYLKVDYRSPTPLHQPLRFEGWLDRVEGRKIFTRGRILHEGTVTAEAEALFVTVDFSRFAAMRRERGG